jgi:hypothetical protein
MTGRVTAYRRAKDEALVRNVIIPSLRLEGLGIQRLTALRRSGHTASIDVTGPEQPAIAGDLARRLADRTGRPVTLVVR